MLQGDDEMLVTYKYHTKQKAKIKKVWFEHGNHIGMEILFQIDKNTFICRKRTN